MTTSTLRTSPVPGTLPAPHSFTHLLRQLICRVALDDKCVFPHHRAQPGDVGLERCPCDICVCMDVYVNLHTAHALRKYEQQETNRGTRLRKTEDGPCAGHPLPPHHTTPRARLIYALRLKMKAFSVLRLSLQGWGNTPAPSWHPAAVLPCTLPS